MNTGTDVSIKVCRMEGYAVVEHWSKKLDPYKAYKITISNPEGWSDYGTTLKKFKGDYYAVNNSYSYHQLWYHWQTVKGINEFCGAARCPFIQPGGEFGNKPSFHDLVHMAQTLHMYCGLQ